MRIFLIVMDSVGIGEAPDAYKFDDKGSDTLGHIATFNQGLKVKNLEALGLGAIRNLEGVSNKPSLNSYYGRLEEVSNGKDTMTGHWEMMGIKTIKPFKTFTDTGFPKELIELLEEKTGRKILGNKSASGTAIIEEYGLHQEKTGDLIVYTSADPVLQIAADENVIPLDELYYICHIAREITLKEEWKVGRIIARPYIKNPDGSYTRTPHRHDYALSPSEDTVLNYLKNDGYDVISVGKISDIFNASGITESNPIVSNHNGMEVTLDICKNKDFNGLCFVNLVDFDSMYGHRRDPIGYKNAIEEFDNDLSPLLEALRDDDILMITADHGNDPTFKGSDHTREYVPLLVYSKNFTEGGNLGILSSFAVLGKTVADYFNVASPKLGESFKDKLK